MPTLELSIDQLAALRDALETFLKLELKEAFESGKDVTQDETVQHCERLFEHIHDTLITLVGPRGVNVRERHEAMNAPTAPSTRPNPER